MHDEGYLLVLRRGTYLCGIRALYLTDQATVAHVGRDAYLHLLLLAPAVGVYLSVVAIAERTVVGYGQESHGVLLVVRHLLVGSTVDGALPDVEGTVLLTEVVERFPVGSPTGRTILPTEGGEFGVLVAAQEPDVPADRTLVVLAEGILITLLVVIQDIAIGIDTDILHGDHTVEPWALATLRVDLIDLREVTLCEYRRLGCGHHRCTEEHMTVVAPGNRSLIGTVGGQPCGRSPILTDHVDIETSLTGGGKGDATSVRTPYGIGVIGGIGRYLPSLSACCRYGEQVSLVREHDGLAIR